MLTGPTKAIESPEGVAHAAFLIYVHAYVFIVFLHVHVTVDHKESEFPEDLFASDDFVDRGYQTEAGLTSDASISFEIGREV